MPTHFIPLSGTIMQTLRINDVHEHVEVLLDFLLDLGFLDPEETTNGFDTGVDLAVMAFQVDNQLLADGIVGKKTWASLLENLPLLRDIKRLQKVRCGPKAHKHKPLDGLDGAEDHVAISFNKFAKLVRLLAKELNISPAAAHAVIATESAGHGKIGGRMVIRFETHLFWRRWGKYNAIAFNKYWDFDEEKPWTGQTFNDKAFHGNQDLEWACVKQAVELGAETEAVISTSLGAPQILGQHWQLLKFKDPAEMFNYMNASERNQIITLFDFIQLNPEMHLALKKKNFETFVRLYNGSGQVETYTKWLVKRYEIAKAIGIKD
jgi:hypothetical protein